MTKFVDESVRLSRAIWTGRVTQATEKYGEKAPMAAVCCNACRTCVTANLLGVVIGAIAGTGDAVSRFARRCFLRA